MAKKDYREKIEEDRQQIEVETELSRLSRSKHKAKKRKNPIISILLITFILIPLSLLVYVKFFYVPKASDPQLAAADEQVQVETNEQAKKQQAAEDKEQKEQDEQAKAAEQAKLDAEKKAAEEQAKLDAEAKKKAEQEAAAKKAEEERKAAEAKKAQEQAAQQQQQQPSSKSHTVQPGENLYRIAMKYYGDPGAVEKIRAANGLNGDEITVGSTLVLP